MFSSDESEEFFYGKNSLLSQGGKNMTSQISENTLSTIDVITPKGDPIPTFGTTQCGKSTTMGFLAESDAVRDLMSMREAEGKGSTLQTNIVVTDSEDISLDLLYVRANMRIHHIATTSDDNEFLSTILHPAVRSYRENGNEDIYRKNIKEIFTNKVSDGANDSLAHMIKGFSDEELEVLSNTILGFPVDTLIVILTEAEAKVEEKNYSQKYKRKAELNMFKDLLSEKADLKEYVNAFWDSIVSGLNSQSELVKNTLIENGAVFDDRGQFTIALGEADFNSDIAKMILDSENEAKEFLFEDMSLIFRGQSAFFENELSYLLTVTELNNKEVHVIRFVDTMGLFHSEGIEADEETDRIMNLLTDNHADKLLLIINGHTSDTVKNGIEATKGFLRKLKRDISIFVLSTHWDEELQQEAKKQNISNRRMRSVSINWEDAYNSACEKQNALIESFESCLVNSNSKAKPHFAGVFNAALILEGNTSCEQVLCEHGIDYENALSSLIKEVLTTMASRGERIKVRGGMENGCTIVPDNRQWDVKSLYRNMVVDCKGHKYWPRSVQSVCDKWMLSADQHDSDIKENNHGFMNIHSSFVVKMRDFSMAILHNSSFIHVDISDYIVSDVDKDAVKADIKRYLNDGNAFGKEFAKRVGKISFEKGFKKNTGYCYQFERLTDMLQYTQDHYFKAEKVTISEDETDEIIAILQIALQATVKSYIDAKCIEVY